VNLLAVLTELVEREAQVMGTGWTGYTRVLSQRQAWQSPAVMVDRVVVTYNSTLAQALVEADLLFVVDESGTDQGCGITRLYEVCSTGDDGVAEDLADVQSLNGLWTDISAEQTEISTRQFGQNQHLVARMPIQMLCPHTPTPPD
jgi:hypothetical protein